MYSLRRPPRTTLPLPQGSSHFGSPGRLPAHARPSGAILVPFISAAITEQSWTSRGYQQKADSWKRRSQQDGSLPELFTIRADWAQPPQPPHDSVVAKQRKRQRRQVADAWVRCVLAGVSERVLFKTRPNSSW